MPKEELPSKENEPRADLTTEQQKYMALLQEQMKQILNGRTKEQLAASGDLAALAEYKAKL